MAVVKRILIVEDDPQFVSIFSRLLRPWSPEIQSTHSGAEAIRRLERQEFDLVTIDLQLPGADATDLLEFISTGSEAQKSRCLIVTSFPMIGKAFSDIPIVAKTSLVDLGPHLMQVLGRPADPTEAVA